MRQQAGEHPGDVYARGQIENWFQLHHGINQRQLARAAAAAAAIGGAGEARGAAEAGLAFARQELAELEAGHAAWREGRQPHHVLVDRLSRVCGSIGGPTVAEALDAAFVETRLSPGQAAALEAGLAPDLEPSLPAGLGPYAEASRAYRVRGATCRDAMRRWGWPSRSPPWRATTPAVPSTATNRCGPRRSRRRSPNCAAAEKRLGRDLDAMSGPARCRRSRERQRFGGHRMSADPCFRTSTAHALVLRLSHDPEIPLPGTDNQT